MELLFLHSSARTLPCSSLQLKNKVKFQFLVWLIILFSRQKNPTFKKFMSTSPFVTSNHDDGLEVLFSFKRWRPRCVHGTHVESKNNVLSNICQENVTPWKPTHQRSFCFKWQCHCSIWVWVHSTFGGSPFLFSEWTPRRTLNGKQRCWINLLIVKSMKPLPDHEETCWPDPFWIGEDASIPPSVL